MPDSPTHADSAHAPRSRADVLAVAAVLVTVTMWASAFVGIRAAAVDLSPGALALGRLLVASAALSILAIRSRPSIPARADAVRILAIGVVWYGCYNLALNAGERLVDAGTAAMIVNVGPILIALFAGLFLGEGFPPRLLLGSAIAFAGTVVIGAATSGAPIDGGGNLPLGITLCLIAAVAYAAGVTLQKPTVRRVPAIEVTWMACLVGALTCLPFAPVLVDELAAARPESIAWMVYLGLFPTAVAFTLWAFALGRTTAGRLGSATYLVPPVVIVMAWLLLGEVPSGLALVGGAVAIGGVIVARSGGPGSRRAPAPATAGT